MTRRVLVAIIALTAGVLACSDSAPTATTPEISERHFPVAAAKVEKPKGDREVVSVSRQLEPWAYATFFVDCPEGKVAVGGGYMFGGDEVVVYSNRPMPAVYEAHRWEFGFGNPSETKTYTVWGYVICVVL